MLRVKKGQTTLEVVVLVGFVVAALIAMGMYVRRGIQGQLRDSTDQVGEQYSAGQTTGAWTVKTKLHQNVDLTTTGQSTTDIIENWQEKEGNEEVISFEDGGGI